MVIRDLAPHLDLPSRTAVEVWKLAEKMKGFKSQWITLPEQTASDLQSLMDLLQKASENKTRTIILFWDELPMMLDNVRKRSGDKASMEVLDTLRAIRQHCPKVRMVFTGSIGIHHVLNALRQSGYRNDATNDMLSVDLNPLQEMHATELALRLVEGEAIATKEKDVIAIEIARASCCVPYYTHHIVQRMKWRGSQVQPGDAAEIVSECIKDVNDPWHLGHYEQRLKTYYSQTDCSIAMAVLDVLSASTAPLMFDDIFKLSRAKGNFVKEDLANVLLLLQLDHYLRKQEKGNLNFRLDLLREWWHTKWEAMNG